MNRGQEFVIGGYFPGPHGFDSLIVGYYDGDKLTYVARTRNGFVPATGLFEIETSGDTGMSVRKSAGDERIGIW